MPRLVVTPTPGCAVSSKLTLPMASPTRLPGVFEAASVASSSGVYRFRVLATGLTVRELPFTREQLLMARFSSVGTILLPPAGRRLTTTSSVCELLHCLLDPKVLGQALARHEIDPTLCAAASTAGARPA